jgi:hypothetical protein
MTVLNQESLVYFSLDYKGIQPGMAAQPIKLRKCVV